VLRVLLENTISMMEQALHAEPVPRPQSVYYDSAHGSPQAVKPGVNMPVVVEDDTVSIATTGGSPGHRSKREKIKMVAHQVKEVPHRMLMRADIMVKAHPEMDADGREIPGVTDNAAFNTNMLNAPEHGTVKEMALKPVHVMQDVGQFIKHPRNHGKRKAASLITADDSPYLGQGMDEELLEAHDKLEEATNARSNSAPVEVDNDEINKHLDVDEDSEIEEARDKIHEIQTKRETLKTAWITGKHVRRVKAAKLPMVAHQPKVEDYNEYDANGNYVRFNWQMYTGHLTQYHTQNFVIGHTEDTNDIYFTRSELLRQAERLLVASAPIQQYLMHVRKVYLWEDTILTTRWFIVWVLLIKFGFTLTFLYWWVCYIVLKHRFTKDSVRFLRESKERVDSGGTPYKISELVGRHGTEDWVDPLIDELGPTLQRQLSDAADYIEILMNFYHWRNPGATINSLIVWFTLGLISFCCSTEYGAKIVMLIAGIYFFGSCPVATKFPRWRKVVSLARMIHWDIPNNAELAFQGLQEDAQKALKRIGNDDIQPSQEGSGIVHSGPMPGVEVSNASSPKRSHAVSRHADDEILAFRGTCGGQLGRLVLTPTSLRFIVTPKLSPPSTPTSSSTNQRILFNHPYTTLSELRKTTSPSRRRQGALKPSNNALTIISILPTSPSTTTTHSKAGAHYPTAPINSHAGNGKQEEEGTLQVVTITHLRKRDEAFNALLGFSAQKWTVQQPLEGVRNGGGEVSEGSGEGGRRTEQDNQEGRKRGGKEESEGVHDGRGVLGTEGEAGEAVEAGHEKKLDRFKDKVRDVLHIDKGGGRGHESNVMQEATRL